MVSNRVFEGVANGCTAFSVSLRLKLRATSAKPRLRGAGAAQIDSQRYEGIGARRRPGLADLARGFSRWASSEAHTVSAFGHAVLLLATTCFLISCGASSGGLIVDNAPPPPKPAPEAPKVPDAWRDHRGDHVALGQKFRLSGKPVAIDGPNVVIALTKVDWSTMTTPSGKEVKEGAASVVVTKGEEPIAGQVPQGDFKRLHGVKFSSVGCGEEYNKQRMTYDPWVELIATTE